MSQRHSAPRRDLTLQQTIIALAGIGRVAVCAHANAVIAVDLRGGADATLLAPWLADGWTVARGRTPLLTRAVSELHAWAAGTCTTFTVPVDHRFVPPFLAKALTACAGLDWGVTSSYGALAQRLRRPGAARAVGQAMARNPTPLIVPCHRVLAANGKLGGFLGNSATALALKQHLLARERQS